MVVVMRHADQRHPFGQAELPGENFRGAGHLIEPAAVKAGGFGGAQQFQALRRFLQHRTGNRAGEIRVIPTGQPGVDIPDIAPDAAQRRHHRVDRTLRIFGRVLVAGKALFLVVDDQARAVGLGHLDQCDAGIVGAGRRRAPRGRRFPRARACRGRARSALSQSPSRAGEIPPAPSVASPAIASREIRLRRAWGVVRQFVCSVPSLRGPVSDGCRPASIIIGRAQQCRSVRRHKPALASPRAACDTCGK